MKSTSNEITGILRESTGKGPSHRLRKAGLLPAIVYAKGKEATSVALTPKEITKALKTPLGRNIMLNLNLENQTGEAGTSKTVMVRDLQKDPVKRNLTHLDFVEINANEPVTVAVPLTFTGKSQSVVAGGKLDQIKHTLKVKVLPAEIPVNIVLDVTELPFGATQASKVQLPKGVELVDAPTDAVATIKIPRAEEETATAEATPVEGAAAPAAATEEKK